MKPLFKHQLLITIISVIAVVVVVLSGSYAIFSKTKQNDEYNKLQVGSLELSYVDLSDDGNVLKLVNSYPISDETGSTGNSYRFSVENTGTITASYTIKITDDQAVIDKDGCSNNLLDKSNLRYKLDNAEPASLEDKEADEYAIYNNVLAPGESDIHEIRIWISEDSGNEVLGQHFHGKVKVDIEQSTAEKTAVETIMALASTATDQIITVNQDATEQTSAATDYRYYGATPNNYVTFNDELWRIIGVFDVDDGTGNIEKRVKIIRNESIGNYSYDSSDSSVNSGYGVNSWKDSDLMTLLNSGAYFNRTSGTCYNGTNNATTACDFMTSGLTENAKLMIDDAKWYTATANTNDSDNLTITASQTYTNERGTITKICTSGDYCNDTITRATSWVGKIGLMYPSDYGYAAGSTCTSTALREYSSRCYTTDWMFDSIVQWTISPFACTSHVVDSFIFNFDGSVVTTTNYNARGVRPATYLASNVIITSGTGTSTDPFELSL